MSGAKQKSRSVSKTGGRRDVAQSVDSRAVRTRAQINNAFVELLHRRSYDNMRVSDITKKAGVGRATFYAHFNSKDDLLRAQVERVVLPMLRVQSEEPFLTDCCSFFEHVTAAPRVYKSLMSCRERAGARVIRETLEHHFDAALRVHSPGRDRIPRLLVRRFVVFVLLGVAAYALSAESTSNPKECRSSFKSSSVQV